MDTLLFVDFFECPDGQFLSIPMGNDDRALVKLLSDVPWQAQADEFFAMPQWHGAHVDGHGWQRMPDYSNPVYRARVVC